MASFRKIPSIEEDVKQKLKQVEAEVDSVIEAVMPTDKSLTKEVIPTSIPNLSQRKSVQDIHNQQALIREVWETVNTSYYNERDPFFSKEKWAKLRDEALRQKPKTKTSAYRLIRTMMASGLNDPFAKLTPADEFGNMQKYDMTGVGLNIGTSEEFYQKVRSKIPGAKKRDKNGVWVLGLLKGSVSDRAGLKQGDEILEIDGVSVDDASPYEVATMIKVNAAQKTVTLKIRTNEGIVQDVQMDGGIYRQTPVVKTSIERARFRKVGRIQVTACNSEARQGILNGLEELKKQRIREVLLDLRGNPGGLVEEAVEIAKLFLGKGDTVVIKKEGPERKETRIVTHQPPQSNVRMTVLVDGRTASAAEIISGALQDNCRAVIAGKQTYGKGLIQSVFQLSDGGGLTLTVGKYYTPNMTDIDQSGIVPNFRRMPRIANADRALKACELRRDKFQK